MWRSQVERDLEGRYDGSEFRNHLLDCRGNP
jgi:hypothetical protein